MVEQLSNEIVITSEMADAGGEAIAEVISNEGDPYQAAPFVFHAMLMKSPQFRGLSLRTDRLDDESDPLCFGTIGG